MADSLAVMRAGTIVQFGAPHDLYRRPVDAWTATFLGDAVLIRGQRIEGHRVETVLGALPLDTDRRAGGDR